MAEVGLANMEEETVLEVKVVVVKISKVVPGGVDVDEIEVSSVELV